MATISALPLVRALDTVGDGTGTVNANVDGSSTPVTFFIQPPALSDFEINCMSITIRDGKIAWDRYGDITGGLTNGVEVRFVSDNLVPPLSLIGNTNIKTNLGWDRVALLAPSDFGTGPVTLFCEWNFATGFAKSGNPRTGLVLNGFRNEKLEVIINDDCTPLEDHFFTVQGVEDLRGESFRNSQ